MNRFSVAEVVRLPTAVPQDSEFSRIRLLKWLTAWGEARDKFQAILSVNSVPSVVKNAIDPCEIPV